MNAHPFHHMHPPPPPSVSVPPSECVPPFVQFGVVLGGGGDYYYEWSRVVWGAGSVVFGLGQLLVAANKNRVYIFSFYLGWFHNFCDPLIRKRSTVLRASEVYKCQNCRQKMQDT